MKLFRRLDTLAEVGRLLFQTCTSDEKYLAKRCEILEYRGVKSQIAGIYLSRELCLFDFCEIKVMPSIYDFLLTL